MAPRHACHSAPCAPTPPWALAADSALIPLGFIPLASVLQEVPRRPTRFPDPTAERLPLGLLETPTQASPGHSSCWD